MGADAHLVRGAAEEISVSEGDGYSDGTGIRSEDERGREEVTNVNKSEIMKARINRGLGRMGQEDEYFLSQIMTFVELYI